MSSITWADPRCVQELGTFLAPQNHIQGRCELFLIRIWLGIFIVEFCDIKCVEIQIRLGDFPAA